MSKVPTSNLFLSLSRHYRFTYYFEILIFFFLILYQECCWKQFLYHVEFICRKVCENKIRVWSFMSLLVSRPPKSGCVFGKFTAEQILKSFCGRNNFLKSPLKAFGYYDSLPHSLEESRQLRALIRYV